MGKARSRACEERVKVFYNTHKVEVVASLIGDSSNVVFAQCVNSRTSIDHSALPHGFASINICASICFNQTELLYSYSSVVTYIIPQTSQPMTMS